MKKKVFAMLTLIASLTICTNAFADWEQDDIGNWRYQNEDGTYQNNGWFQDPEDEKWYYFDEYGNMESDTITPDGYRLDETGARVIGPGGNGIHSYDYVVNDTLTFLYNGTPVELPCRIYYNQYSRNKFAVAVFESVYIQPWDGQGTNIIVDYRPTRSKPEYDNLTCDIYINGEKYMTLGMTEGIGLDGSLILPYDQKEIIISIPTETFKPGDMIEFQLQ